MAVIIAPMQPGETWTGSDAGCVVGYSEVVRFKIVRLLCKSRCLDDRSFPRRDRATKIIIFLEKCLEVRHTRVTTRFWAGK